MKVKHNGWVTGIFDIAVQDLLKQHENQARENRPTLGIEPKPLSEWVAMNEKFANHCIKETTTEYDVECHWCGQRIEYNYI